MNVLITGATGFVGRYVTRELKQLGGIVTLGRRGDIIVDLAKEPTVSDQAQLPSSVDVVVHLAALTQKTKKDRTMPGEYQKQNVAGTKHLLDLINRTHVGQFIFVSTLDVYGDTQGKPITERTTPRPQSPYAKSKYEAEGCCLDWASKRGIPCCVARLGLVYGPGEEAYEKVIPLYIRDALHKQALTVYGKGETTRDFIYVGDVARAIRLLIKKKSSGIYNIASGTTMTIADLAQLINKLTKNTAGSIAVTPESAQTSICFDITKLRQLGFVPTVPLEMGLSYEISTYV
jgi:UDP-glucose 4-epimerase